MTAVADVSLKLVAWVDEEGIEHTQLAVVGKNNVNMLDMREIGFGTERVKAGRAPKWLKEKIINFGKEEVPKEQK